LLRRLRKAVEITAAIREGAAVSRAMKRAVTPHFLVYAKIATAENLNTAVV